MSAGCDSDDVGYGAQFQAECDCDDDRRVYYDSLTPEVLGSGWFDQGLVNLHQGIDITSSRSFFASPRANDTQPSNIPARHPLRALAWVLAEAPVNSTVRIYCYMLTDPFAIKLLIHHGSNKTIQIILHTDIKNKSRLQEFLMTTGISLGELFVTASKFESRTLAVTTLHRCTTIRSSQRTTVLLEATTYLIHHNTRTGNRFMLLIVINPKFNVLIKSGILSRIETFKLCIPIWFLHRHFSLKKEHEVNCLTRLLNKWQNRSTNQNVHSFIIIVFLLFFLYYSVLYLLGSMIFIYETQNNSEWFINVVYKTSKNVSMSTSLSLIHTQQWQQTNDTKQIIFEIS